MIHKAQHAVEGLFIFLTIKWQPLFGIAASLAAIMYYGSMIKMNVVDTRFAGSWGKYFKSFFRWK